MINNPLSNHLNRYQNNTNGAGSASHAKGRHKAGKNEDADEAQVKKDETAAGTEKESGAARARHRHGHADAYAKATATEAKPSTPQGDTVELSSSAKAQSTVAADADGKKTVESNSSEVKKGEAKAEDKSTSKADDNLTPEQRRQKELDETRKKVEEDYAAKYPHLAKKDKERADAAEATETAQTILNTDKAEDLKDKPGIKDFINDMPLFEEFKTSLMDAFRRLDSATSGSISAQYELNYTSMQYIANEAGGYSYTETSMNIKLDLNYIKAAGGGGVSAGDIADAIENAEDFESFVSVLQDIAKQQASGQTNGSGKTPVAGAETEAADKTDGSKKQDDAFSQYRNDDGKLMNARQLMNAAFKNVSADGVMKGMADYFGPEATAGRISDFAEALFGMSDEYKNGGDTEEARQAYVDRMGKAIEKGFSQAIGSMGSLYSGSVADGVEKTRELVFANLDKFVKGKEAAEEDGTTTDETSTDKTADKAADKAKENQKEEEKKQALQNLFFSYQSSYSQKTTTFTYGAAANNAAAGLFNTEA